MPKPFLNDTLKKILWLGWEGRCPRCEKGRMFRSWLKIVDRCESCGLDYRFAAPDDGPAFFSLCIIAFPLVFVVLWIEMHFEPPWWVHLFTSVPLMIGGCLLPLRPIKGWLVASQYINRAQEHGTRNLWNQLQGFDEQADTFGAVDGENRSTQADAPTPGGR